MREHSPVCLTARFAFEQNHSARSMKMNIKLPRSTWRFNPVTRVKQSAKRYIRARAKLAARRQVDD